MVRHGLTKKELQLKIFKNHSKVAYCGHLVDMFGTNFQMGSNQKFWKNHKNSRNVNQCLMYKFLVNKINVSIKEAYKYGTFWK